MDTKDEPTSLLNEKVAEEPSPSIDFVTLGMFIIGKSAVSAPPFHTHQEKLHRLLFRITSNPRFPSANSGFCASKWSLLSRLPADV